MINMEQPTTGQHNTISFNTIKNLRQKEDKPEPNKSYLLFGKSEEKAISKGNTWQESEVRE